MDLSINEGTLVVTGGPGDTLQTAIVIEKDATRPQRGGRGIHAARQMVRRAAEGLDAEAAGDAEVEGRTYDAYEVVLADGSLKRLFFDVSEWLSRSART